MGEIVHVQLGQCGNKIGLKFWELILSEHLLDIRGRRKSIYCCERFPFQFEYVDVFFMESKEDKRFVPRAILADTDAAHLSQIVERSPYNKLFRPDNIVHDTTGAGNNWAKGYYKEANVGNLIMECVRKEVEACDLLQGVQIVHSLAGGTGSGTGSLIAKMMFDEYPNKILKSYTVIPSVKECKVQQSAIFNTVLSIRYLMDCIHQVFCLNNDALHDICLNELKRHCKDYHDINYLIAQCMSDITSCSRFPGQLNSSFRKIMMNTVPFPLLHFLVPTHVPLNSIKWKPDYALLYLTRQMFDHKNMFFNCDVRLGQYLTVAVIFRDSVTSQEVGQYLWHVREKNSAHFVEWIPRNFKTIICYKPRLRRGEEICATLLANTTAIQHPFKELLEYYKTLFNNKFSLHYYFIEGMEKADFEEAQEKLQFLISEYENNQDQLDLKAHEQKFRP